MSAQEAVQAPQPYFSKRLGRMVEVNYPVMATRPHPGITINTPDGGVWWECMFPPGSIGYKTSGWIKRPSPHGPLFS